MLTLKMEKCVEKTTIVVIFNLQNSHSLTLFSSTEEVFQVNDQNRPMANLLVVDFHSHSKEMPTPKPLKFEAHSLSAIRIF